MEFYQRSLTPPKRSSDIMADELKKKKNLLSRIFICNFQFSQTEPLATAPLITVSRLSALSHPPVTNIKQLLQPEGETYREIERERWREGEREKGRRTGGEETETDEPRQR